jgi:arsenite methyltransferase
MQEHQNLENIREAVRKHYARTAVTQQPGEVPHSASCCTQGGNAEKIARAIGYSRDDLQNAPIGANLGLGCGNPQALADLKPGETVLDLGSGAGFDCFLAARKVGPDGRVIGVDMTPEMIGKARENARTVQASNVQFYLGEIEKLPVPDDHVDVIISNCVINLSPEKARAFREAFRVLKPGGRLAISDIVTLAPLPEAIKENLEAVASCIGGAQPVDEIRKLLSETGFKDIVVDIDQASQDAVQPCAPANVAGCLASASIKAKKPE